MKNMENILDKVTEEQLEVSKKLGELKNKVYKWSKMTKDTEEEDKLFNIAAKIKLAEKLYDDWMLEVNNE